jgi:hypothetical protein
MNVRVLCNDGGPPEFDTNCRKSLICIEAPGRAATTATTTRVLAGFLDVERGQHCGLLGVDGGDARDRRGPIDADAMTLNPAQLCQGPFRTELALGRLPSYSAPDE